jgi:hypothetical protein
MKRKKLDPDLPIYFRALSIQQPFAYFIASGMVPALNYSWTTDFRGPLLICADHGVVNDWQSKIPLEFLPRFLASKSRSAMASRGFSEVQHANHKLPCHVVGCAHLSEIIPPGKTNSSPWAGALYNTFVLIDPILFDQPIPYKLRSDIKRQTIRQVRTVDLPRPMIDKFLDYSKIREAYNVN